MKKRVLSMITSLVIFCSLFAVSTTSVQASENDIPKVDGSYLTMDDYSEGHSSNSLQRGKHMMTGECSISKAGRDEIYCYASTTASHEVDKLAVLIYVDQYQEDVGKWGQIDAWVEETTNDYFVITNKMLEVDRGYYYRVRAEHFVVDGDDPVEETFSVTNGIYLPK